MQPGGSTAQSAHSQHTPCPVLTPRRAAGALPLPAGRAPALPVPGASSAGVQLRTAGSLESLPNQAFCYLAQATASRGRWFSGCFLSRTVIPCVTHAFTGEKSIRFWVGFRVDHTEERSEDFSPRGFAEIHRSSHCPKRETTVAMRNWHSANISK